MGRNVLIPVDGSDNAQRAFDFFLENMYRNGDHIYICFVQSTPHLPVMSLHDPMAFPAEEWTKKIREEVDKSNKLMEHYEMICEGKKIPKTVLLDNGKPGEAIVRNIKKANANLIVMGTRGLNAVRRTFVGSVSDYVVHHSSIPVTVVPSPN